MTYGEVRLLLGAPYARSSDPAELRRHAWGKWSGLSDRVDEGWVYRSYYNTEAYEIYAIYFRQRTVDTIVSYSWGWPSSRPCPGESAAPIAGDYATGAISTSDTLGNGSDNRSVSVPSRTLSRRSGSTRSSPWRVRMASSCASLGS